MNLPPGKLSLLLVDDEERILRSLAMLFRGAYRLQGTTDPQAALALVERETVHVIVSDQKMPTMRGAELLREVRSRSPHTMRILLTGYSELDAVVASVNEGEIFRYVSKPWDAAELRATVDEAAQIARSQLEAPLAASIATAAPGAAEGILVIDDDAEVFRIVREVAGTAQPAYWARSMEQAFELLAAQNIGVVVSELRAGGESLTAALKLLKAQHPEVVTIVMTPFEDTGVLVGLINQGHVFRLLPKPVRRGPLGMNVASALRQHRVLKASPILRRRHQVEKIRQPEEVSVTARVMGFLGRLRRAAI
jgi:serine/threonine-protein kinase